MTVEHLARRDAHVRDVHQAHHEGRLETLGRYWKADR